MRSVHGGRQLIFIWVCGGGSGYIGSLVVLDLGKGNGFTAADLVSLRGLPLTSLNLGTTGDFSGALPEALAGMPLQSLSLAWDMTGEGLEVIKGMALTDLDLSHTQITDAELKLLHGMPLTKLNLDGTQVTRLGLEELIDLPLVELSAYHCGGLVPGELMEFWKEHFGN